MASEYVLVPKNKYQQLEKDAQQVHPSTTHDKGNKPPPPPPSPTKVAGRGEPSTNTHDDSVNAVTQRAPTQAKIQYARRSTALPPRRDDNDDGDEEDLDMDTVADYDGGDTDGDNDYDVTDVLQSFTSKELTYVQPLLKLIEGHSNVMTWNHSTGEIVFRGQTVAHSNIVELLKDTLTAELHPIGKMEFFRALDMMNVKLATIKHPKNKALLAIVKDDKRIRQTQSKTKVKRLKPVQSETTASSSSSSWLHWK